ncbi:MAG: helix-turn-helix domain-containing protein [candidate division WOR-3 bacterium]|nr:helix-turn-helix domain-containing protein [candidate division WOR-3 bacterium]
MKASAKNTKYFTLKEVSNLTGLPVHIIKYWRKEFNFRLQKNSVNRQIYSQEDVDRLLLIKYLRQQEKLTIAGIKLRLKTLKEKTKTKTTNELRHNLLRMQKELLAIKNLLQQTISDE